MTPALDGLEQAMRAALGPAAVDASPATRQLLGQDIFRRGAPVALVVRPADVAGVIRVVSVARAHGVQVAVRGGGMSYTQGYLSRQPDCTVVIDMAALNTIREINSADLYAVVEAGCTWAAVDAALVPHGLRARQWGPLSGRIATVGGSASQNAIFWGAGVAGSLADNVLGAEVVTGQGAIVRTGSLGVDGCNAFFRHFGPDLTGLFLSDAGAMGIKTALVLPLEPRPAESTGLSFRVGDAAALLAAMAGIARAGLAAQQMAVDAALDAAQARGMGWRERARVAARMVRGVSLRPRGLAAAAAACWRGLRAGPVRAKGFALHVCVEADGPRALHERVAQVRRIALATGSAEMAGAVPRALLADPFPPLHGLTGPRGERWVPVHGILPLSRALAAYRAIEAVFAGHAEAMVRHGLRHALLVSSIGRNALVLEPMLFWPDTLPELHRAVLAPDRLARFASHADNPAGRAIVAGLRKDLVAALDRCGATHIQLGNFYAHAPRLGEAAVDLLESLRRHCDPAGIIQPDALRGTAP